MDSSPPNPRWLKIARRRDTALAFVGIITAVAIVGITMEARIQEAELERIEMSMVSDDLKQAQDVLMGVRADLESRATDWGAWDDTWAFMADRNSEYIQSNLGTIAVAGLDVDLLVLLDPTGRVVASRAVDPEALVPLPVPPVFQEGQQTPLDLSPLLSSSKATSGLLSLSSGQEAGPVVVFATSPILTSDRKGEPRGHLLVARNLDDELAANLSGWTHLDVRFHPLEDPDLPPQVRSSSSSGPILSVPFTGDNAEAWRILTDVRGSPAAWLQIRSPRAAFQQSRNVVRGFRFLLVSVTLLMAGAVGWLLDRLIRSLAAQRKHEALAGAVVQQATEGIVLVDLQTQAILQCNAAVEAMTFRASGSLVGRTLRDLLAEEDSHIVDKALQNRHGWVAEARLRRADGTVQVVELSASHVDHEESRLLCLMVADISSRMDSRAGRWLYPTLDQDPVTGLPNRQHFREQLAAAVAKAERASSQLAVLFVDLDEFKTINDSLGHDAGDRLLKSVAQRLKAAVRVDDVIARQGGDEFMVMLSNVSGPELAVLVAERLMAELSAPVNLDGECVYVMASVGIALYPTDGRNVEELTRAADIAMYHAKQSGKNRHRLFDTTMNARMERVHLIRNRLGTALANNEFSMVYQPIVRLPEGNIVAMEALLRWNNPETGPISPAEFIPIAEDMGLIGRIGEWTLRTACAQARAWQEICGRPIQVAVNLSPRQFKDPSTVETVSKVLTDTGLDPSLLEVEVTESTAMWNMGEAVQMLTRLRALGISISLDDFGTGHSSFAWLRDFPLNTVKIDRSFLMGIADSPKNLDVVSGIIAMAHTLGLEVVAEGVEQPTYVTPLMKLSCDRVQGYGLCRPLPPKDLEPMLLRKWDFLKSNLQPAVG